MRAGKQTVFLYSLPETSHFAGDLWKSTNLESTHLGLSKRNGTVFGRARAGGDLAAGGMGE